MWAGPAVKHSVPPLEMYTCGYGYRSGINRTMRDHLADITCKVQQIVCLEKNDVVLDIGSNDGTLLKSYSRNDIQRIGMDPGGEQYKKYYPDNILLVSDFFTAANFKLYSPKKRQKLSPPLRCSTIWKSRWTLSIILGRFSIRMASGFSKIVPADHA